MHIRFYIILCSVFFLFLLFHACNKEKEIESNYPRVATGNVTNIKEGAGATFNGSFLQAGTEEIIDHGFLFGESLKLTIQTDERISLGPSTGKGSFSAKFNRAMVKEKPYYVSAYGQTKNYIYYAEAVKFVSKGGLSTEILQIVPCEGVVGDTVVAIKGKHFSNSINRNTVKFNNQTAKLVSASDTAIVIRVPSSEGKEFADIFVTVAEVMAQKIDGFKYLKPEIIDFWPKEGIYLDTIYVKERNYSKQTASYFCSLLFGKEYAKIISASDSMFKVVVPMSNGNEKAPIVLSADGFTAISGTAFQYMKPVISGFSPASGRVGTKVTITGQYFSNNKNTVRVTCGDFELDVESCSSNQITVTIPNTAASVKQPIKVSADGYDGFSEAPFEIISPWTKKAALPTGGRLFPITSTYNNEGYIAWGSQGLNWGGYTDCWKYNNTEDLWQVVTTNWGEYREFPVCFQMDNLWFFGSGNDFYQASLESFQWKVLARLPQQRMSRTFSFVIDNKAYVCGGNYLNTVWQYDQSTNAWEKKAPLPGLERGWGIAFSHNGKGYAGLGTCNTHLLNDFYEYDSQFDTWTRKADFPERALRGTIVFTINNRVFVGLGLSQGGSPTESKRDIWEYDPVSDRWYHVAIIPNYGGEGAFVFVINNKAYIGGGNTIFNSPVNQDFYEFDPSKL